MPPYRSVPSLKVIGRDKVLYKVCEIIIEEIFFSDDENWEIFGPPSLSSRLQITRDILANSLSADLLEEILNTILEKDEDVETTVRYIALQMLLVEGVRVLSVGHFPESYYSFVLEAIAEKCASLQTLNMSGIWVRPKDKFAFCKVIRRLNSVRKLTLRYVCDDELLQIIGKHCTSLQTLDISGSEKISFEGLEMFVSNHCKSLGRSTSDFYSTLQIIDIGGPGANQLSPSLGAKVILSFPNLKSLGSFAKTGQSLEEIVKSNPNYKCGLRYLHDVGTNSQRLRAIATSCPDLQAVYLDCPGSVAVQHLHMLKNLTEVKLHKTKWEDVLILTQSCGNRLRSLILLTVWGPIKLLELGSLCPQLIHLELYSVSLMCVNEIHPAALKDLRELLIFNSQITTTCTKFILNQCTSVQTLSLGDCAQLSDAAVISSLMDHSLKQCQSIWFGQAENLTERTVDALIEHCPKLMNLGNLAGWDITSDDINLIRCKILSQNQDLSLHEYGPEEHTVIAL